MENISCLIPGNETIHAGSSQDFSNPLLFVCKNVEMKMRMTGEGGWIFCLIPCHENMQSSVGCEAGRRSEEK